MVPGVGRGVSRRGGASEGDGIPPYGISILPRANGAVKRDEEVVVISLLIPGLGAFAWRHLVLDVNGTLTVGGELVPGVPERVRVLAGRLEVHLLTADIRGNVADLARRLGVAWTQVQREHEDEQKRDYVEGLGAEGVIAIGNGNNDALMLSAASLGIVVIGPEGAATRAIMAADLAVHDIVDALDVLLDTTRLSATLRT